MENLTINADTLVFGIITIAVIVILVLLRFNNKTAKKAITYFKGISDVIDQIVEEVVKANEDLDLANPTEETDTKLIELVIIKLQEAGEKFGIDLSLLKKIPTAVLAEIIHESLERIAGSTDKKAVETEDPKKIEEIPDKTE